MKKAAFLSRKTVFFSLCALICAASSPCVFAEPSGVPAEEKTFSSTMPVLEPEALMKMREDAEAGDVFAQILLGGCFLNGIGVPENITEAERWLRLAAALEEPLAYFHLGNLLMRKDDADSEREAVALWERASAAGVVPAMFNLGLAKLRGIGDLPDVSAAMNLFWRTASAELQPEDTDGADCVEKAREALEIFLPEALLSVPLDEIRSRAEAGDAAAELALALRLRDAVGGVEEAEGNREEALEWMARAQMHREAAADGGNAEAPEWTDAREVFWKPDIMRETAREEMLRKQADAGDVRAASLLAYIYLGLIESSPREPNPELAEKYLRIGAEGGDAHAQHNLAVFLKRNSADGTEEAEKWMRLAAEQGDPDAMRALSAWFDGTEEGRAWMRRAAEGGDAVSQFNLGIAFRDGGDGFPQDSAEALKWLRLAAEQGDAEMQRALGEFLVLGDGVPENKEEAAKWFLRSAEQGCADAQTYLGVMCRDGVGVPRDAAQAAKWLRAAAEQGNACSQFELARAYISGEGVELDWNEAEKWLCLAAEQGLEQSWLLLGILLKERPEGKAEAAKWLRLAAEQGDADAQIGLGGMLFDGDGVPADKPEAAKLFRAAAEQGNATAQYNLAVMLLDGDGVPADEAEAAKWARLAAEQGEEKAAELLAEIEAPEGEESGE